MADEEDVGCLFAEAEQPAQPTEEESYVDFAMPIPGKDGVELKLTRSTKHHSLWGHMLWNGARYYAERLAAGEIDVRHKAVLEVGSGLGVPSIVSALVGGARTVVVTDYPDEAVLKLLQRNVDQNRPTDVPEKDEQGRRSYPIDVKGFLWGKDEAEKTALEVTGGNGFDVMILSDVIFNHSCHRALVKSISRCLARDPRAEAHVIFTHYRPHKKAEDMAFFDLLKPMGLTFEHIRSERVPLMFPNDPGCEIDRSTVHHYIVRHVFDAAGAPIEESMFDVVIQGTGLVESLCSAALSRSGKKVLHVDIADFYGGAHYSAPIAQFAEHITKYCQTPKIIRRAEEDPKLARQFSLDLLPQLFMANSSLIDKLMESNTAKYLEFQNMDRLVTFKHPETEGSGAVISRVPLNRSDIFKHCRWLSPLEMRQLMKLVAQVEETLKAKATGTTDEDSADAQTAAEGAKTKETSGSFVDMLRSKFKLSQQTIDLLTLHGQLIPAETAVAEGFDRIGRFMGSVGRFDGATPFLVAQYGCGELPQNMCRVAAVWGAMFILQRQVTGVQADSETDLLNLTLQNGQVVHAKHFIAPRQALSVEGGNQPSYAMSRVVIVTKRPLVAWTDMERICSDEAEEEDEKAQRTSWPVPALVGVLPRSGADSASGAITFLQLGATTQHTPRGTFCVLHFTADASIVPQDALEAAVQSRFLSSRHASSEEELVSLAEEDILFHCAFTLDASAIPACRAPTTVASNSLTASKVLPIEPIMPGFDDSVYCLEAERVFDLVHDNATKRKNHTSESSEASTEPPVIFLEYIPDAASQVNFNEADDEARLLGVDG